MTTPADRAAPTPAPHPDATSPSREPALLARTRHPARVVVTAVVAAVVLTLMGFVLSAHPVDLGADVALNRLRTGLLGALATAVYHVVGPVPAVLGTAVLTALLAARTRSLRVAAAWAGVIAGTWLSVAVVKLLVHRPRPDVTALAHPWTPTLTDPSYPSGHTAFVAALAFATALLLRGTRWGRAAVVVGTVVVALVGVALVVDGVHYPSDVVASVVWALAVAPAVRWVWVDLVMPRLPLLGRRPE